MQKLKYFLAEHCSTLSFVLLILTSLKLYLQEKPDPGVDLTVLNLENFLNMVENIESNLPFKFSSDSCHQDRKDLQVQVILLAQQLLDKLVHGSTYKIILLLPL